jgi:hypothetical protein
MNIIPKDDLAIHDLHRLAFRILLYLEAVLENFIEIGNRITFDFQIANLGDISGLDDSLHDEAE